MIKLLAAIFFAAVFSVNASTQPRGADRLRELVVFPEMNGNFNFEMRLQGNDWMVVNGADSSGEISQLREGLKHQPDNVKQLLRLGFLLDSNGQTNESQAYYQKAEQLCRDKVAGNPQDGLNLTDLGEALSGLGQRDEADSVYHQATLVSSNDWSCWVKRGNFLADGFILLFPEKLRAQHSYSYQSPSQEVLDYWPSAEALKKAENSLAVASQCFDRAKALAPGESEVFFQYAGYLSVSNWQNCFFSHYRDYEKINSQRWFMPFFSPETIANLKKAAELKPKDYQCLSLAAFFEYCASVIQANVTNFTADMLPDKTRQSIHDAMAQLESLSGDSDKKTAAGALENLEFLNMILGNNLVATASFRRAVALDPTREQSWDLLLGTLAESGSSEENMAVCEARLKQKDSARNHLLLARAFEHQKKLDKAGEQTEAALKVEPGNVVAELELLALELKQSADPDHMSKAFKQFVRIGEISKANPHKKNMEYWREVKLNQAIFNGLANTPTSQKTAAQCIQQVLKLYPNDEQAKEISKALNQSAG